MASTRKQQQDSDSSEEVEENSSSNDSEVELNNQSKPRHPLRVSNSQPSRKSHRNDSQKHISGGKTKV